jgi:hypothetical protein
MPSRLNLYHCERMFLLHCDGADSCFTLHHHFLGSAWHRMAGRRYGVQKYLGILFGRVVADNETLPFVT